MRGPVCVTRIVSRQDQGMLPLNSSASKSYSPQSYVPELPIAFWRAPDGQAHRIRLKRGRCGKFLLPLTCTGDPGCDCFAKFASENKGRLFALSWEKALKATP